MYTLLHNIIKNIVEFQGGEKRYLLCPVGLTIGLVKKFIRLKFELEEKYQVSP